MYKLVTLRDTYTKEVTGTGLVRVSDNAWIPQVEANTDYQAYLKWLSEGNEPLPADGE